MVFLPACAVPLGPGYRIEREQLEVRYVVAAPTHLHVRASYRLKNIGTRDLAFIEAALPDEQSFGRENLRAEVEGREVSLQPAREVRASVSIPFDPPWPEKQRRSMVLE